MEYKLKSGYILTDEEIERRASEYESGKWKGTLEDIKVGRPAVYDETLVTVAVKFPKSMVDMIDEKSTNRSDFIRRAVANSL